jgi:hypothetical protein
MGDEMIRFEYAKRGDRFFGVSGVVSEHTKQIFIFLWFFEIDFIYFPKDWMLPGKEIIGGKEYNVSIRNIKYDNEEITTFIFPDRI